MRGSTGRLASATSRSSGASSTRDAPWLRISRADLGAIDRLLGLDAGEEREAGDDAAFAIAGRSEEDAEFLVVVNAIRNLVREHPAYEHFLLTEDDDF